jgi:hypothetical protein
MNILVTAPTYLYGTLYNAGQVLEIPNECYQPNSMTRIGTNPTAQLAGRIALSTLVPGMPSVAAS